MRLVTMKQIDNLRAMANETLESLRAAKAERQMDNHLVATTIVLQGLYSAYIDSIGNLLRDYHEQRSPTNLLRLLKHTVQPCGKAFYLCDDCSAIDALVREMPWSW